MKFLYWHAKGFYYLSAIGCLFSTLIGSVSEIRPLCVCQTQLPFYYLKINKSHEQARAVRGFSSLLDILSFIQVVVANTVRCSWFFLMVFAFVNIFLRSTMLAVILFPEARREKWRWRTSSLPARNLLVLDLDQELASRKKCYLPPKI